MEVGRWKSWRRVEVSTSLQVKLDPDYAAYAGKLDPVVSFHGLSLVIGALLAAGAILYKRFVGGESELPTHFLYLVAAGIVPSVGLYRSVREAMKVWLASGMSWREAAAGRRR